MSLVSLIKQDAEEYYSAASSSESEDWTHPDFEMNAEIGVDGPCLGRAGMEHHLW